MEEDGDSASDDAGHPPSADLDAGMGGSQQVPLRAGLNADVVEYLDEQNVRNDILKGRAVGSHQTDSPGGSGASNFCQRVTTRMWVDMRMRMKSERSGKVVNVGHVRDHLSEMLFDGYRPPRRVRSIGILRACVRVRGLDPEWPTVTHVTFLQTGIYDALGRKAPQDAAVFGPLWSAAGPDGTVALASHTYEMRGTHNVRVALSHEHCEEPLVFVDTRQGHAEVLVRVLVEYA